MQARRNLTAGQPAPPATPYALFRFDGKPHAIWQKDDFDHMVRVGRMCDCKSCLCCRALEYAKENHVDDAST